MYNDINYSNLYIPGTGDSFPNLKGGWFFLGTLVSFTNKTDCHNITEILLKVALNTINQTKSNIC